MAHPKSTGRNFKKRKNRETKINLVFDITKRREFLTGFHKRKLQRKQAAKERLEKQLKDEQKRLKAEAKENFKKLVLSHRTIPELDDFFKEHDEKEEYEDGDVTVKVVELNSNDIAIQNNWIGDNKPHYLNTSIKQEDDPNDDDDDNNKIKGMETKDQSQREFKSKKEIKKLLKKKATQKVKNSEIFKKKNQYERRRQLKKTKESKKQQKRQEKQNERVNKKRKK